MFLYYLKIIVNLWFNMIKEHSAWCNMIRSIVPKYGLKNWRLAMQWDWSWRPTCQDRIKRFNPDLLPCFIEISTRPLTGTVTCRHHYLQRSLLAGCFKKLAGLLPLTTLVELAVIKAACLLLVALDVRYCLALSHAHCCSPHIATTGLDSRVQIRSVAGNPLP